MFAVSIIALWSFSATIAGYVIRIIPAAEKLDENGITIMTTFLFDIVMTIGLLVIYNKNLKIFVKEKTYRANLEIIRDVAYGFILTIIVAQFLSLCFVLAHIGNIEQYAILEGEISDNKNMIYIFLLVIVAPIFEEILYRGCIFTVLRDNFGFWPGAIVSAALWGYGHPTAIQAVMMFFNGIIFSYFYNKRGNILEPILMNVLMNASTLLV